MRPFYQFLKENLKTADTIYISSRKDKSILKVRISGSIILKHYKFDIEKIKNKEIILSNICDTYEPSRNNSIIWNEYPKDYTVSSVRFLLFKIEEKVYFFGFDGGISHLDMIYFLNTKDSYKSLNFEELYNYFYEVIYDEEKSEKLDLEKDNWCFPFGLKKGKFEIFMTKKQFEIYFDKNIHEYFGLTKEQFTDRSHYF
jgi:hypothetical protein